MKFCVLASGSSGNAYVIVDGPHKVLIDAGLSPKCIRERLRALSIPDGGWRGFLLTHEHGDHAKYAQEMGIQIGWRAMRLDDRQAQRLYGDVCAYAGDCPHGTTTSTAYSIEGGPDLSVFLATDISGLGETAESMIGHASLIAIEANWDPEMLEACDRDEKAKERSRTSHLSNQKAAEILFGCSAKTVVAVHLSKPCNSPERVRQALEPTVKMFGGKLIVAGDEPICVEV